MLPPTGKLKDGNVAPTELDSSQTRQARRMADTGSMHRVRGGVRVGRRVWVRVRVRASVRVRARFRVRVRIREGTR